MKNDVKKLAAEYIHEVIEDQKKLGYTAQVGTKVRNQAERRAESVFEELATTTGSDARAA